MANKIIDRIRTVFTKSDFEETVRKRVKEEVDKSKTDDILRFSPNGLVTGSNSSVVSSKFSSMGVSFQTLRDFADYYPVVRACIEFRKSQITHLDWTISPLEITNESVQDKKNIANSKEIKEMFIHPTGRKEYSFTNWIKQILEDLLAIDAVAIYRRRSRNNKIIGYLPVDAATIELMLNFDGTTPEAPEIAYVQKVHGQEVAKLTTDDLIYAMMTPRTYSAYGFAPLESLIVTVSTALKLQAYNFATLQEGNIPEGFITLPRDIASSRDQLKEWQDAWDAMISGDPRFQKKLKFLPEGMEYKPSKTSEDMTFERFEKWLVSVTCSVFGLHPSAIGFGFDINRSTAQSMWEAGRERGLFPTALFLKEILDRMIQDDLGYSDMQFVWTNIDPTNKAEEAKVVTSLVNAGLMSIDEWRLGEGLKPTGINDPFLMTPIGPIFVKDLQAQSNAGQQPVAPYKPVGAESDVQTTRNLPIPSQGKSAVDFMEDLKKWRKSALNDLKRGVPFREFKSDVIDERTSFLIRKGLSNCKNREAVQIIFKPFLDKEHFTSNALLNLYDGITTIITES
jgi:hypothetical protein